MNQVFRKGHESEAKTLAWDAWMAYHHLLQLAARKDFKLKQQADGKAVLEHRWNKATIRVCVDAESLPAEAKQILANLLRT